MVSDSAYETELRGRNASAQSDEPWGTSKRGWAPLGGVRRAGSTRPGFGRTLHKDAQLSQNCGMHILTKLSLLQLT